MEASSEFGVNTPWVGLGGGDDFVDDSVSDDDSVPSSSSDLSVMDLSVIDLVGLHHGNSLTAILVLMFG